MVKFNSLFTLFSLIYLVTFVKALELKGDCIKLQEAIKSEKIKIHDCQAGSNNNNIYAITLTGDTLTQKVIDKIAKLERDYPILEINFKGIKKYQENLNIENVKVNRLHISDFPIDTFSSTAKTSYTYRSYTLPKGFLKSAKHISIIVIEGFNINQRIIDEISSLKKISFINLGYCSFESGLDVSKFRNLNNLEFLYFGDFEAKNTEKIHQFDGFNETFCQFKKLKSLSVRHSNISRIPDCIKNLKYLEQIDFDDNKIYRIPSAVSKLENLNSIFLSNNKIKEIPNHMSNLKKLKTLYLNFNMISTVPEFLGQLPELNDLDLYGNKISTVPDSVKKIPNLMIENQKVN